MSKAHIDAFVTQVQEIKMNSTGKIVDFVNRIKTLANKLAAVGVGTVVRVNGTARIGGCRTL